MAKLFTSRLRFDLSETVENDNRDVEIEARFRKLNIKQISLLIEHLERSSASKKTSFTIDYYLGSNQRVTQEGSKYYIINKKTIFSKIPFSSGKDIKISVAYESPPDETIEPKNYKLKRIKDRTSYIEDNFQIDITKIDENGEKRTEVELEVIDSKIFNVDTFEEKIISIYNIMTDNSDIVLSFLNQKIADKISNEVATIYPFLSRPRDLLIKDMTKDGLLQDYTVSVKADGLQKLMIFYNNQIWLFSPKDDDINKSLFFLSEYQNSSWNNTILIGEWVSKENHDYNHDYLYLPFDTLIYNNRDTRSEDYITRLSYLTNFYDNLVNNTYITKKLIFIYNNNETSFYQATNQALDAEKEVKYETDGLIFTPIKSPYITSGQRLSSRNQKDRILSKYHDVCKYKPPEKLTIDFLVKKDGLYTKEGKFKGTNYQPFNNTNYVIEDKYLNKIVEFEPKIIEGNIIYHPLRIRIDKNYPNKLKQVLDNWNLVHNPITEKTMRGENIQLMRRYHNQIKSQILQQISGMVIDIGAGAGGVFDKYIANPNIGQVLSIEPNRNFGQEFKRRRALLKNPDQFKLIEAGGEDSNKIIEAAKDFFPLEFEENDLNICFHISLSFFWQNKKMLNSLAKTIGEIEKLYQERKGKGKIKIVYLTIEGNRLNKLFEKEGNTIELNNILLRRMKKNEVFINIKDSITVHDQIEYLVYLQDLWQLIDYYPSFEKEADNDNKHGFILSTSELTYSKLFVYGIAEKKEIEKIEESTISEDNNCLPVDEKRGHKTEFGIQAKGDDERREFKKNHHRLATLNTHGKIYHALLKLLSQNYRNSDVYNRVKLANDLKQKLRASQDLNYISKRLDVGIKVINENKIYGEDKNKFIILYRCSDGEYEPVVYHDDRDHMLFKPESCILA